MRRFRIATYNIHKGRGMDWRVRIGRILRVLREVNADIITLQEVVNLPERSPEEHQATYLAEELGFFYSVGETRKLGDAGYGNVTLSRWRFEAVRHIDLSVAGYEPRGVLRTDIRLDQEVLHVFNVHLGTGVGERDEQARLIDERLLKSLDVPGHRIVIGDFNEWKHGAVTKTLTREFHLNDLAEHIPRIRGYPALMPLLHIDHIYLDHELRIEKANFHRSWLSLAASDHLPLVAEVAFRRPR